MSRQSDRENYPNLYKPEVSVNAAAGTEIGKAMADMITMSLKEWRAVRMEFNGSTYQVDPQQLIEYIYESADKDQHKQTA